GLAGERQEGGRGRVGERNRADDAVLRQRERGLFRVPLLVDEDRAGLQVDLLPAQRVELAGPHPLVDRDVQERRERRWRQLVGELHEAGDVDLCRRLRVTAAAARAPTQLRGRGGIDQPTGPTRRGG